MTNLKLNSDGDYEYDNRAAGDTIRITVGYWKDTRHRGVYVRISPLYLKGGSMQCMLGHNKSSLLLALPRKNDKALAALVARLDELVPEAARLFEGRGPEGVVDDDHVLFAQQKRIVAFGDGGAAIDLLRQAVVDDAAAVSRVAKQ